MKPKGLAKTLLGTSALTAAIVVSFIAPSAHAATEDWTGATNGLWGLNTNWSGSTTPDSTYDLTILGPSNVAGALNINIAAAAAANSINFTNTAATTLTNTTSGANQTLTLGSGGLTTGTGAVTIGSATANQNVNIALGASQIWNIGAGGLTATNVISGSGFGLTKTGTGTLTLTGANTFTGGVTLNAGTLQVGASSTPTSGTVTSGPLGTGTLTLAGGTFGFTGGAFTVANTVNVTGATNIQVASGQNDTVSGNWSGSGNLTLVANGTTGQWAFAGDNSGYTGTFTQNAGNTSLRFDNQNSGSASAAWVFNNATAQRVRLNFTTGTINFGSISGNGSIANISSGTATMSVGALNTSTTYSGIIGDGTAAVALTKVGTGTLTLSAAGGSQFTGTTLVNAGAVKLGIASALQNSAFDTSSAGTLDLNGFKAPTLGGLTGSTNIASANITGYGNVTALTLNPQSGVTSTYSGNLSNGAAGMTLTKSGAGTQVLAGTNTYTGATTVSNGTLSITGNSTGLTGGFVVNSSGTNTTTLTLNGNTGSLASNAAIQLNGGIFNYQHATAGATFDASGLTFSGSDRNYLSTYGTSGNAVLNLANATRTAGTTNNYTTSGGTNGTTNKITFTSAPSTNALVDKGDYFGGTSYLAYDSTNSAARAYNYSTDANGATAAAGATMGSVTGKNVDVTGAISAQTTDSINTLRLGTTNGVAITAANTLSVDGILKAGGNAATISGGSIQTVGSGGEMVIRSNAANDTLTITSAIADNGTSSLTKSGLGTLNLNSANGYAGGTNLNSGILNVGNATALGTGAVTMQGGILRVAGAFTVSNNIVATNAGGLITVGSAADVTLTGTLSGSGNLTLGGNGTNNNSVNVTFAANNMTSGTITMGSGNGTPRLKNTASSSSAVDWVFQNGSTEVSGTWNFGSFGGTGNFNAFNNNSGTTLYSIGGSNHDAEYSGVLSANGTGQVLSILKIGTGSQAFYGNNTYTGTTTVQNGSLIAGATVNSGAASAFGNASSAIALGDATTISSGTAMNPKLLIGGAYTMGRAITVGANNNALGNAGTTFTIGGSTANSSTFSGVTTLNQSLSVTQVVGGTLNLTGNITGGSAGTKTLTFNNVGAVAQSTGVIGGGTGTIAVIQAGSGTTTLSGTNTYTGATTVAAGRLALSSTGSINSASALTVSNGAAFDVSAKGAYTMGTGGTTIGIGATTAGLFDGSNTTAVTLGNALALNFGTASLGATSYNLFDYASQTGDFSGITLTGAITGSLTLTSTDTWTGTAGGYDFSFSEATGVLSVVPEPSAALLGGLGLLGLLRRRRVA